MTATVREIGLSPHVPKVDGPGHTPAHAGQAELFQDARPSFRPAKPGPRIGIKQWIFQALPDFKGIGNRILSTERKERAEEKRLRLPPEEIDGDPAEDGKAIAKILRDDDNRRFDLDWLDHCEAEYGQDWMGAFLTFLNDRYGFAPVVAVPDPVRDAERQKRLEAKVAQGVDLLAEALSELRATKGQR